MSDVVLEKLLDFITRHFMVEREEIDLDKSMIDEGIIDSFGLVEIATYMENEFGMKITEDQMVRDNFGSVNRIVGFIERGKEFHRKDAKDAKEDEKKK